MKKTIYISGLTSIVILLVMFYFHSVSSSTSNDLPVDKIQNFNQEFNQDGNNQSSFSPQSGGWQLQVMPNMGSRLVRDLYFTDSLTGYAVASPESYTDSAHILKTTNGGNNWAIKFTKEGKLNRIIFLNSQIGFAGGDFLLKTTNSGENWMVWNWSLSRAVDDMQLFGEDTIWYAYSDPTSGGLFRTTNGGINWEKRDNGIPANSYPDRIYFYNSRNGFAYHEGVSFCYKTTDGGSSWIQQQGDFSKIYFFDSLNGYKAAGGFFRTSNGGVNWSQDSLPDVIGNTYTVKWTNNFTIINDSIIYLIGAYFQYLSNLSTKALVYKTTNSGLNWGYQIPDTSYNFFTLTKLFSLNKNNVWLYSTWKGLFSSTGGDSTVFVVVNNISADIPKEYKLEQNYPNPFNSTTNIKYKILKSSVVRINVMDVLGRRIQTIVNQKHSPGTYQISFDGNSLPSGIYFYQLIVDNKIMHTRRMALLK